MARLPSSELPVNTTDLPILVKVGWRDYPIEPYEQRVAFKDRAWGHTDSDPPKIRIDAGATSRQQAAALLHEIMHACAAVFCAPTAQVGATGTADTEESWVMPLADGLATVWRDNPEVMRWIGEQLK